MQSSQFNLDLLKKHGKDIYLSPSTEIRRPQLAVLGSHVAIDSGFYCTTQLQIGDYVHISPQVTVIGGAAGILTIGSFVTLSSGVRIICGSDSFSGNGLVGPLIPQELQNEINYDPVVIQNFANICTNAVIAPGVTIGEGCVVGAGSFVNKSTEPWTFYVGSPARPVKKRPRDKMIECAKKLGYTE